MRLWFSPKIKWSIFKKLNAPYHGDIVPQHGDKILWQMLRDRQINIYFSDLKKDKNDPIIITINPIKGGMIIGNK